MHKTRNDIPEANRAALCELLNARLADALDLYAQTKEAHWNVKGQNFIFLHELFDAIGTRVLAQIDEMAERITALGGYAEGTLQVAVKRTTLKQYPLHITAGIDHVKYLSTSFGVYANNVRKAIELAEAQNDADTTDIFTGISKVADKDLWLLEAHLQG
jgi:starvation-inducible DNA-binding protein